MINPNKLFLIDSFGAFITAIMLRFVLINFETHFGMPRQVLYLLSVIACLYGVYSLLCYFRINENWKPFLKAIAIANLIYSALTMGLAIYLYEKLTLLGLLYFAVEAMIIVLLGSLEYKTSSDTSSPK